MTSDGRIGHTPIVGNKPPNRPETNAYNHTTKKLPAAHAISTLSLSVLQSGPRSQAWAPRSKKPICPAMSARSRSASRPSRGLAIGVHAGADDLRGKHPFVWSPQPSVAGCSDDDPSSF
jgi:hypothetical protein